MCVFPLVQFRRKRVGLLASGIKSYRPETEMGKSFNSLIFMPIFLPFLFLIRWRISQMIFSIMPRVSAIFRNGEPLATTSC